MANIVNKYETIFIVDAALAEDQIAALVEKFRSMIANAGEIEVVEEWGKRRLAYPINDKNEGYYVLVRFSAPTEFPKELARVYGITDGIMRTLIIKRDEAKEAANERAAAAKKKAREKAAPVAPVAEEAPAATEEAPASEEA
ncbi:MAG: 30S ribosomal protein S6 [Clostridia bacterium]|nr:30S ribosomal protein S6 [Clostridia bacterium]